MPDCVFCNIVDGAIKSNIIYQDAKITVFPDIHPKADTHLLIIPNQHIASLNHLDESHEHLLSHMLNMLPKLAKQQGLSSGFRTIINTGKGGGQEIDHLHFHLIGGHNIPGF